MGRQLILQVLTFAGGILLARRLDPAEFGLYAIATFLVSAFALVGDFGLVPSLIQRRETITDRDLQVGFTLQQILISIVVAALFVGAPWLAALYPEAPPGTAWLVRALAFSLYLTSLRSMSVLQLERELQYGRLAGIEVVETLSFQSIAVILAIGGYGVWSFAWAALARGLIGAILVFLVAPWKVRFAFDNQIALRMIRFGIPFQAQSVVNQVSGWVTPLLVGTLIGPRAVGFLTWASSNGKKPLSLVDNVTRVAFPHFSRIQDDGAEVERTLGRYLTYLLLPAGLWFATLATAGSIIVEWVYTAKWSPAVPALILYAAALPFDVTGWLVAVALNGTGRVAYTTKIAATRTVAQLVLSIPLTIQFGFNGVPLAMLLGSMVSVPWILRGLGPGAATRTLRTAVWIAWPTAISVVVGIVVTILLGDGGTHAMLAVAAIAGAFLGTALVAAPPWLREATRNALKFDRLPNDPVPAPVGDMPRQSRRGKRSI